MLDNGARVLFQGCSVCPSRLCEVVQLAGIVFLCALADGPGVSLGVCLMEDIWVNSEGGRSVSHLFFGGRFGGGEPVKFTGPRAYMRKQIWRPRIVIRWRSG